MAPISGLKLLRSVFDSYVEIFERSGDPAAAWGAFCLARRHGFDLPAAIDAEVDRFAGAIEFNAFRLLTKLGTHDNKEVSLDNETVGKLWKGKRNRNAGGAIFRTHRSSALAIAVARLCIGGTPKTKAVAKVAEDHGTNKTTVWDALDEHPDACDLAPDELGIPFD